MNTNVQYIKDFQGNEILAVLPIEEYRFLRERADYSDEEDISEDYKLLLEQRIEKYKKHPELLIPFEEVRKEIRNEFGI